MDPETGYQYLQTRYYDPTTAQFLTRDPADATTRSAYGYVGDNPLNRTDPSGLQPGPPAGGPPSSEDYLHAQNQTAVTLDEARALAEQAGLDLTQVDLNYAATDWPTLYGFTDFVSPNEPLVVDGKFQITLTNNGLSCSEEAIETIGHELEHVNQYLRGDPQDEAQAEAAGVAAYDQYVANAAAGEDLSGTLSALAEDLGQAADDGGQIIEDLLGGL